MKLKLTILAAVAAMVLPSSAAIYVVSNVVSGTGATEALFQNEDGTLSSGGIVALGYFPTNAYVPSSSLLDINTTISDFTVTASALSGSFSVDLGAAQPGYVQAAPVDLANIPIGNAMVGRAVYVFVGNGATLATSTQWALKQIGSILPDDPFEQEYYANPLGGAAPVIGSIGTFTGDASGFGSSVYSTLQMVAVPEPSAALLGALGAIGLLRRRRI